MHSGSAPHARSVAVTQATDTEFQLQFKNDTARLGYLKNQRTHADDGSSAGTGGPAGRRFDSWGRGRISPTPGPLQACSSLPLLHLAKDTRVAGWNRASLTDWPPLVDGVQARKRSPILGSGPSRGVSPSGSVSGTRCMSGEQRGSCGTSPYPLNDPPWPFSRTPSEAGQALHACARSPFAR